MLARLGGLSPHPGGSKGVRRSGIIAAVHTGVQQPSVTLPVNLAQNDWENEWEMQDRRRFCQVFSAAGIWIGNTYRALVLPRFQSPRGTVYTYMY